MKKQMMTAVLTVAMMTSMVLPAMAVEDDAKVLDTVMETMSETVDEASEETEIQTEIVETEETEIQSTTETEAVIEAEAEAQPGLYEGLVSDEEGPLEVVISEDEELQSLFNTINLNDQEVIDPNSMLCAVYKYMYYRMDYAHEVLRLVNIERSKYNLSPLVWDSELEEAAMLRASECTMVWGHKRPNGGDCFSICDRMTAENIAADQLTPAQVVDAWMNSNGHRANILSPNSTCLGVSCAYELNEYGNVTGIYWVQCFGSDRGDNQNVTDLAQGGASVKLVFYGSEKARLVKSFVIRLYTVVLGRGADPDGVATWLTELMVYGNSGADVASGFINSPEFLNKNTSDEAYVDTLYHTMFDRVGDPGGTQSWLQRLKEGFSRNYVFYGFAESAEFTQLCKNFDINRGTVSLTENRDQNEGVTRFVSRIYSKALGRTPDAEGLNTWTGQILTKKMSPAQVASSFFFSQEMLNKKLSDKDYVTLLYRVFMDREPDQGGLDTWLRVLAQGGTRQKVMDGFAYSVEFSQIARSYGL